MTLLEFIFGIIIAVLITIVLLCEIVVRYDTDRIRKENKKLKNKEREEK